MPLHEVGVHVSCTKASKSELPKWTGTRPNASNSSRLTPLPANAIPLKPAFPLQGAEEILSRRSSCYTGTASTLHFQHVSRSSDFPPGLLAAPEKEVLTVCCPVRLITINSKVRAA